MLFPEFTAGELLLRSCRSALQARIAAQSRSYRKIIYNDRVNIDAEVGLDFCIQSGKRPGWLAYMLKPDIINKIVDYCYSR